MNYKTREQVRAQLTNVFSNLTGNRKVAGELAFHMTDWKENLEQIVEIFDEDKEFSDDQIERIIITFLAHVPNHVAAAKKLIGLGPIEDVFNLGVTEED